MKKRPSIWEKLSQIFKTQTRFCKICFKEIKRNNFHNFLSKEFYVCDKCLNDMKPIFIEFKFCNKDCLAIYEYNETLKSLIFKYKGCKDFELKDCFIKPYKNELKILYKGYEIVPIPSYFLDDEKRGFNHVFSMYECLNLKMNCCLEKIENINQHNLTYLKRIKSNNYRLKNEHDLKNKKILIVDDVMTTGNTLKSCIELIEAEHPKKIKVLVLSKRILSKEEELKIEKLKNISQT